MDVAFTHNPPPLEFDLQFVMFVEFRLRLENESVVNNPPPPPFSEVHSVISIEFKLMSEEEAFRYNAPPFEFAVQFVMFVVRRERVRRERVPDDASTQSAPPS